MSCSNDALDHPEDFLWVRRTDPLGEFVHRLPQCRSESLDVIPGDRLRELYYGAAAPEDGDPDGRGGPGSNEERR
jgi:hypothetical protein